jgi:hypothetical protein
MVLKQDLTKNGRQIFLFIKMAKNMVISRELNTHK